MQFQYTVSDFKYDEKAENLPFEVGKKLIENNISISCCESCTGGMFAAAITEVPGISAVFDRGLVTYSWNAKMQELGVKLSTLEAFTAESPEVGYEMAEGLHSVSGSDICISITGVAGPDDLSPDKPAGLAYIGLYHNGVTKVIETRQKNTDRHTNRRIMMLTMYYEISKLI